MANLGIKTLTVDLDPQANLTSALMDEPALEALWSKDDSTILGAVAPILEGIGDVANIPALEVRDDLFLIPGNLGLSRFEDKLSESWSKGFGGDPAALRVTSAFHRLIRTVGTSVGAQIVLMDVGPNLGAINRAALLAADHLLIPLAADLYSLQGLRNLGPTVRKWKTDWRRTLDNTQVGFSLPSGNMSPIGYVVLQHAVRLDRPVKAYKKWLDRIPSEYRKSVLGDETTLWQQQLPGEVDPNSLATLRNYRSLMPMAQDARKPMFELRPSDGAIGSHAQYVQTCYVEFRNLTEQILGRMGISGF